VEGVKAHARFGNPGLGADRLLIAGRHVDRDRLDRRLLLVCELVEECLQGGGVAARRGPHDPAGLVVGDAGEEAMVGLVGDLVDAEHHEPVEAVGVEVV
jgi:hypothetical protein